MAKFTTRPVIMGRKGVVASGHYMATVAGFRIMEQGGNAIDAAAATCFCLNILEPQSNGIAGEVPTLIYSARDKKVYAISGVGWSPAAFTIEWCRENGIDPPMGTRGQMFNLNPDRPNALQPRKRQRATLTPSLVTREGQPHMVFGTPGGDTQDQITLQFFLNVVDFDMDIQEALDAPTTYSAHFPSSFYPREALTGKLVAEARISKEVIEALERRGHEVGLTGEWATGKAMGIRYNPDSGLIEGGVSPRHQIGYAIGS